MGWGGGGEWRKGTTLTYMNLYMSFRAKLLALSHSLSPPFSPRNYQTTGNTLCRPLVHINSTTYNPYISCFILTSFTHPSPSFIISSITPHNSSFIFSPFDCRRGWRGVEGETIYFLPLGSLYSEMSTVETTRQWSGWKVPTASSLISQ